MKKFYINRWGKIVACKHKRHCRHEHFQSVMIAEQHQAYRETDPRRLSAFAAHSEVEVRRAVAANEATRPELLHVLAIDDSWSGRNVRRAVAENPNTATETLELMSQERDGSVRVQEAIALHPNTSLAALTRLARHRDSDVRSNVASNPNTPYDLLEFLAEDIERVRDAVLERCRELPLNEAIFLTALAGAHADAEALDF